MVDHIGRSTAVATGSLFPNHLEIHMTKVMAGALVVLVTALALVLWLLSRQIGVSQDLRTENAGLTAEVSGLKDQIGFRDELADRLDGIQSALNTTRAANQTRFGQVERLIRTIPRSEGDSDASLTCLTTPVPAALDRVLRDGGSSN